MYFELFPSDVSAAQHHLFSCWLISRHTNLTMLWLDPAQHVQFYMRDIIWGHHKMGTWLYQPSFQRFSFINSQVHNLLLSFVQGYFSEKQYSTLLVKMCAQFSVSLVFGCFPKKSIFHFYISKEITNLQGIFMHTLRQSGWNRKRSPISIKNTKIYYFWPLFDTI